MFVPDFNDLEVNYPYLDGRIPPGYIEKVGAPLFTRKAWSQMQKLSDQVPDMRNFPPMNSREVVQLLQWNAPERILGQCPTQPAINRDLLIAVAEGVFEAEAEKVDRLLDHWFNQPEPVEICNQEGDVLPLKFFLDRIDYPEWTPVVRVSDSMCIRINQGPLLRLKVE